MNCDVGYRYHSDLMLLWLWCRLSAVAPVGPLAWETPYATDAALISKKKKKKTNFRIANSLRGSQDSAYSHPYGYNSYSKKRQGKIKKKKEKAHGSKSGGRNQAKVPNSPFPVASHISSSNELWEHMCNVCLGKLIRASDPKVFIWGWPLRYPLLTMHHESRFPE